MSDRRTPIGRRTVLKSGLMTLGGLYAASALPRFALAQSGDDGDRYETETGGEIVVRPVQHASLVIETPTEVIYVDPVGGAAVYEGLAPPNLVMITHEHGDHYDPETLAAIVAEETRLITNPAVFGMLPGELRERAVALGNGDESDTETLRINAVPAYNLTADRLQFHPEGRDNGYVLTIGGKRVYVAGDTEAVPEMRQLADIDVAFVPMNLPYTMGVEQAADGVLEFAPAVVYPYHYRGKDEMSDTGEFARLVNEGSGDVEVALRDWYG